MDLIQTKIVDMIQQGGNVKTYDELEDGSITSGAFVARLACVEPVSNG